MGSKKTWYVRIKTGTTSYSVVTIQAEHLSAARKLAEMQYGKGSIVAGPQPSPLA